MTNIRAGRDSNPVPLGFKPQPERMSSWRQSSLYLSGCQGSADYDNQNKHRKSTPYYFDAGPTSKLTLYNISKPDLLLGLT